MIAQVASMPCFPEPDWFASARAVSPAASYPMEDTWVEQPYVPGVVLIGDAAG